ncbi:hypothetical protein N431DRAFT_186797 [Stipitochalara longipes BDJ]|nr:hypothetical protein N431DRAFT_186797 [Stipitochalara longipes BDJ]
MNHHRPRPGRTAVRNTVCILKWILSAVFILFLGLQTIPHSTNLVQHEETTLRQHETIRHLDASPTSSPLTKAMKVLLHHLPARRSERAGQDNTHELALSSNATREGEEYHDSSRELISHDRAISGGSQIEHTDPSNERDVVDGTTSRIEKQDHETIRDLIGHDNTGHLCSTMDCFCKSTGRCKRESIHANIAYKDPSGKNERAVMSNPVDEELAHKRSRHGGKLRNHEMHGRPRRPCQCWQHHRECSCYDNKDHSAERTHVKKETERIGINAIPHFRPSNPSSKLAVYRSNEIEATDGTFEKNSLQQESDSQVDRLIDHNRESPDASPSFCLHDPNHQECRRSTLGGSGSGSPFQAGHSIPRVGSSRTPSSLSMPSSARASNSSRCHRPPAYKRATADHDAGSTACNCNDSSTGCHCGESLQLKHLQTSRKRDVFASPDAGNRKIARQIWEEHKRPGDLGYHGPCRCASCTGMRNWFYKGLTGGRDQPRDPTKPHDLIEHHAALSSNCNCSLKDRKCDCDIQQSHTSIHGGGFDSSAGLADTCGLVTGENSDSTNSVHITEAKNRLEPLSEILGSKALHDLHLTPSPGDLDVTPTRDATTQFCSEGSWLRRPNCRPRPVDLLKTRSVTRFRRDDSKEIHTSEHMADIFRSKRQIDRAIVKMPHHLETPVQEDVEIVTIKASDSILERRQLYHKPWRWHTTCLPKHSVALTAKAIQHLLRRDSTLLESITEAKCRDKVGEDKEDCEQKHKTGFWIVCSLLAVAGICGLLLGILVLHLHFRRKRPNPLLISSRHVNKGMVSTPKTSVGEIQFPKASRPFGMRRIEEDEIGETGSVRRYTTLDGTNDGWTRWIHKQKQGTKMSQKGVLPPTPAARAPRIPTLKLPQTTLAATMRKINGLGSERESASQGYHTWKGKRKDMTKVRWCSTV